MTVKFQLGLYTGSALHERARFEALWTLFSEPAVGARSWGRLERTTEPFSPDPAQAFEVLKTAGWLFVSGSKNGFKCMIRRWRGSLYGVDVWLTASTLENERRREAWLAWMFRLIEAHPVLFGHGETGPENDAKHLIETEERMTWLGVSYAEMHQFLPGIYWLTVFGTALSKALPFDRIADMPEVTLRRLAHDQVAVLLNEPPKPSELASRLAVERKVAAVLGDDLFYDRERPDRALRAVPAFVADLERFKGLAS
jgi:hypothetical protein